MIIKSATLKTLLAGFTSLYSASLTAATVNYEKVAMVVPSTTSEQKYGWLGQFPRFREWIGDRVINNLKEHGYAIVNKTFETTIAVKREDIEDDNIGQYSPLFQTLGDDSAKHPDQLVFELLKAGFATKCYDGQFFFDTDHPVIDENGVEQSVSNSGGGAGNAWFLLDVSKPIKPVILQKRRDYALTAKDNPEDENVFMRNEFVYGVDARVNVGFGLWQLAYGSRQPLDVAAYEAARASVLSRTGDHGKKLALNPNLLVVGPSNEGKARRLVKAEKDANGADNVWYGTAEVLVVSWLD
ncbi:MAG: Mu-like prophage major head subunit gpT family protein [Alphaproteobacteria bacterium]|nr:Mu-like prophage major head subunit gpT family protein [Alphaproteobacteria bacterium]